MLLMVSTNLVSQPIIDWHKTYGGSYWDESLCIQQTSDGGYITVGRTGSSNGDIFGHRGGFDIWILKLNNSGSIEWKKVLGGTGTDIAYTVFQTNDGGYFISSYTSSNNYDVLGNHGGDYDGWVVKLSSTGNIEWQKALGGSGWDAIWSSKQTDDNGFILAGRSNSSDGDVSENKGTFDYWIVKLDENGAIEWSKTFGGSMEDIGKTVMQTEDGGYLVAGESASTDGDMTASLHGNYDIWLIKLSGSGEMEWQQSYGGSAFETPSEIISANDEGYVITGYTGSPDGDVTGNHGILDVWVIKISNTGELIWQNALGGNQPDWGRAIVPAVNGGYIVAGTTHSSNGDVVGNDGGSEFWLVKLSEEGELIWQQTYGGSMPDECFSIDNTTDNGFILSGFTWSTDGDLAGSENKGYNDYCIIKLNPEPLSGTLSPLQIPGHLEIYPNPASQYISLKTPKDSPPIQIKILDVLGREVLQEDISNEEQISVQSLPNGIYTVLASTLDGKEYVGKVQKQ
ncbi:MAG: T9SS type A sorting domain-containing protein [Saprospiraceae bacterium]|nr:T9SS type A sorting domain-containing protein [Saprospiraceae bacterium]